MPRHSQQSDLDTRTLREVIRIQTQVVRCGLDLGGVMNQICECAKEITHAAGAVVELVKGDEMVYSAVSGSTSSQLGLRIPISGSLAGLSVTSKHVQITDDAERDSRVDIGACRKVGIRSMVVVPLMHEDKAVGALKVVSGQVNAFTQTHVATLELMSDLIAAAMFHAVRLESSKLYHNATHDTLTNIPNRALFYDRLRHAIAQAERRRERFAILCVDMNELKSINDNYGHRAGDAAIQAFANRLKSEIRESDLVARIGGDEFAIILSNVQQRSHAEEKLDQILDALEFGFVFEGHELNMSGSVGLAVYPDDNTEIEQLIEIADQRMYSNKRAQKLSKHLCS